MPVFSPHDVAVVIPSGPGWERAEVLERTLDGLARQTVSGFEVSLVVDGTGPPPPGIEARMAAGALRVLARPHDGPGPRRNAGARATQRPIVLLLGDDTIPLPQLVARHLARHNRCPSPEEAVLGRVDWHPECERGRLQRWLDWSHTQFDYDSIVGDDAGWGRLYSSNLSIKREFLLDVGGFDEDFTFGYEDTELGLRLDAKGLRLGYEPAARALHVHHYSWPALERRFALVGAGEHRMTDKHPDFAPYFLHRVLHRRRAPRWAPWPWAVELIPRGTLAGKDSAPARLGAKLRHALEIRADAWYYARLTGAFMSGWVGAAEESERRSYLAAARSRSHSLPVRAAGDRWRAHRLAELRRVATPNSCLLDCNADAGSDGLALLAAGYDVSFHRRSEDEAAFVRWRLRQRSIEAPVYGPADRTPPAFDVVYSFGVVETAPRPVVLLAHLERLGSVVAATVAEGPALRHALRQGRNRRVLRYRRIGGGHLAVYRSGQDLSSPDLSSPDLSSPDLSGRVRPLDMARSTWRRAVGRHLPPSKPWTVDPRW